MATGSKQKEPRRPSAGPSTGTDRLTSEQAHVNVTYPLPSDVHAAAKFIAARKGVALQDLLASWSIECARAEAKRAKAGLLEEADRKQREIDGMRALVLDAD